MFKETAYHEEIIKLINKLTQHVPGDTITSLSVFIMEEVKNGRSDFGRIIDAIYEAIASEKSLFQFFRNMRSGEERIKTLLSQRGLSFALRLFFAQRDN